MNLIMDISICPKGKGEGLNIMRRIVFSLLVFALLSNLSYSQVKNERINPQQVQIEQLSRKVDSLIASKEQHKSAILEQRMIQATETIANQNAIISSFSTLYTIITIIFALIGIALPILTYQFGIKPSRDALTEFERHSEEKFDKFLSVNKAKEIENAINSLLNEDLAIRNNAINFLALNYHIGFNQGQISKILNIIEQKLLDNTDVNQLHYCISFKRNVEVRNYFGKLLMRLSEKEVTELHYCLKFLVLYGYDNYKDSIRQYVKNNEGNYWYSTVTAILSQFSKADLFHLLNDEQIFNDLSEEEITNIRDTYKSSSNYLRITTEEFESTYLFKNIVNV